MGLVQRSWVVIIVPAGIHTRAALDWSENPIRRGFHMSALQRVMRRSRVGLWLSWPFHIRATLDENPSEFQMFTRRRETQPSRLLVVLGIHIRAVSVREAPYELHMSASQCHM